METARTESPMHRLMNIQTTASSALRSIRTSTLALGLATVVACGDTTGPEDAVLPEGTIVFGTYIPESSQVQLPEALWHVARNGVVRSHPTFSAVRYSALVPSADHRQFAYVAAGRLILDDAKGTRRILSEPPQGSAGSFSWSPDGRHIAFQRGRDGGGTDVSIVRVADGAMVTPSASIGGGCTNDPNSPRLFLTGWETPDQFAFYWSICLARDRYYVATTAGDLEERPSPGPFRLVAPDRQQVLTLPGFVPTVSNIDGSAPRVLANFTGWSEGARWSPSGRHIVMAEQKPGCVPFHLLAVDGSGGYRISDDPSCPFALSWSPSGEWIATTVRNSEAPVLRLYRANGGEVREVPLSLPPGHRLLTAAWIAD
jgi:dipeptidyl aminopeptidase/acylaminoacyl peptidase